MTTRTIAKVTATMLGIEDHGILTAMLQVDYGGNSGQGVGGYSLDTPIYDDADKFIGRCGTAYGMEWVRRTLLACGVETWEAIKGRTIMVIKDGDGWGMPPVGIGPLPTEPGKDFLFADIASLGLEPNNA